MGKRRRSSAEDSDVSMAEGGDNLQEPESKTFPVRTIIQHRAGTQSYAFSSEQLQSFDALLDKMHTEVPITAAKTLFGKPVTRVVLLLQETGPNRMSQCRFVRIYAGDHKTYAAWYQRNVKHNPRKNLKELRIEIHMLVDVQEGDSARHSRWYEAIKLMGDGGAAPESLKKEYRQITKAKSASLSGLDPFKQIPVAQIDEKAAVNCMLASEYREMPSTDGWFPKRSGDPTFKRPQDRVTGKPRRNKRTRRSKAVDEGNVIYRPDEEAEDDEMVSIGVEEQGDDEDDAEFGFGEDMESALAEAGVESGDDQSQALEQVLVNWKMDLSVRLKSAD
ncbi:hypothetical protein H2200_008698 [Cladophialophora chaetospira]|uniref:Uncharacterized protein n=1 Tax=Cladophialophora chaetospira TaxID=386627 RepID=A0AA38X4M6_9EURO|nr:hypothetical protein H2200_008698 [Cladophialophora chaetospira]